MAENHFFCMKSKNYSSFIPVLFFAEIEIK